jgi:hypothetical protein
MTTAFVTRPLRFLCRRFFSVVPPPRRLLRHLTLTLDFDDWTAAHPIPVLFTSRESLYAATHAALNCSRIDYLEFGVYRGRSLRHWLDINTDPESRFFGFDSFAGLPEAWETGVARRRPSGAFNTGGRVPKVDDPRVKFVTGWFQETLDQFLTGYQPRPPVIVHLDSDLYSSTLYCLTMLNRALPVGSVLIFDEFCHPDHEFRAFVDYTAAYRRGYRLLGTVGRYVQVAFQLE